MQIRLLKGKDLRKSKKKVSTALKKMMKFNFINKGIIKNESELNY